MTYPFPALVGQLQYLLTPSRYKQMSATIKQTYDPKFWKAMPKYIYAQCPFCGKVYIEAGNSYEIWGWGYQGLAPNLCAVGDFGEREEALHCSHFLGIRKYINLHRILPELEYGMDNANGEVPFLDDFFYRQGVATYCILHGMPVCGIENNKFVPRYTVFLMTYFSENPKQVVEKVYASQDIYAEIDPEYWATLVKDPIHAKAVHYDLANYSLEGQLGWMDYTLPSLPLRLGVGEQLPDIYRAIEGNRSPYKIHRTK